MTPPPSRRAFVAVAGGGGDRAASCATASETSDSLRLPTTASLPSTSGQGHAAATARLAPERSAEERVRTAEEQARGRTTIEGTIRKSLDAPIGGSTRTLGWISQPDTYPSRQRHAAAQSHDRFTEITPNPVKVVAEEPVSTFSIDVDTASYGFMRAALNAGFLPEKDAVAHRGTRQLLPLRLPPAGDSRPAVRHPRLGDAGTVERCGPADAHRHQRLRARPKRRAAGEPRVPCRHLGLDERAEQAAAPHPLAQAVADRAGARDRVAIVAYAGAAGVVLAPTRARNGARFWPASNVCTRPAPRPARRASAQHIAWPGSTSSRAGSTASSSPPTGTSTSASPTRIRWRTTLRASARAASPCRCSASGWATTTTS